MQAGDSGEWRRGTVVKAKQKWFADNLEVLGITINVPFLDAKSFA